MDKHEQEENEPEKAVADAGPLAEEAGEPADGTGEPADGENPPTELLKRLNEAEESARIHREKYLRTVADLENFRRRMAKERDDLREMAVASVIEELLPAMDNLRLGLRAADNHPEARDVAEGFRMVAGQLRKALESFGLEEESPTGGTFDPNLHDCMAHEPHDEIPEGVVVQTVRPGFRLRKRLLRPASVVVSSGPPAKEEEQ
ncbi:MAG: nucleotide exchange factor GrpE [Puniceicoccaceae bacterium]